MLFGQTETKQEGTTLTVNIQGLSSDIGVVYVGLYDSEGNWLGKSFASQWSTIKDGKATLVLENIPPGVYAISAYHDENENKKLDTGWFGIPTEGYACSRGATGRFGPPSWTDAKFEIVTSPTTQDIQF